MEDLTKTIMFTTNNIQTAPATIQYQTTDLNQKQPKIEKNTGGNQQQQQQTQEFPTFCYANVNMIQKLTPTSQVYKICIFNEINNRINIKYSLFSFG